MGDNEEDFAGEEEEIEEIPLEEKLGILRYFITNSPPGHQKTVLEAAKKLNLSDAVDDATLSSIFRDFNVATNVVIPRDDGTKEGGHFLVDAKGEVDAERTSYLHPHKNEVFTLNQVEGTVAGVRAATAAEMNEEGITAERDAVDKAVREYATANFVKDKWALAVYPDGKKKELAIVISSENKKLNVFWSGRWQSHWTLSLGDGSASISGEIRVLCHYYEGGNVQMVQEKDYDEETFEFSDAADLAKKTVEKIQANESALQKNISELYQTMELLAKGMRRNLPINKQEFDWVNYQKYQVRDQYANMTVTRGRKR